MSGGLSFLRGVRGHRHQGPGRWLTHMVDFRKQLPFIASSQPAGELFGLLVAVLAPIQEELEVPVPARTATMRTPLSSGDRTHAPRHSATSPGLTARPRSSSNRARPPHSAKAVETSVGNQRATQALTPRVLTHSPRERPRTGRYRRSPRCAWPRAGSGSGNRPGTCGTWSSPP